MKSKYILVASFILAQVIYVKGSGWGVFGAAASKLQQIRIVQVQNHGKHHAHLWCADKNRRIGGNDGIWVKPGGNLEFSFRKSGSAQFWCTMDWYGQRVGWDVYVHNWHDAPNPTKWSIRNDGVYDQWKNRKWRNLNS